MISYHWDKFWYVACLEIFKIDKYTTYGLIYGPPGALVGPKASFKEPGVPLTYNYYNKMCFDKFHY